MCAIHRATTVPVDDQKWLPWFSNRPIADDVPEYEYGNDDRFVVLTVHNSLRSVQIETSLSEQNVDLAEEVSFTPFCNMYRASVDHAELRSPEEIVSSSGSIYTLILERWVEKGWPAPMRILSYFTGDVHCAVAETGNIPGWDETCERVGAAKMLTGGICRQNLRQYRWFED